MGLFGKSKKDKERKEARAALKHLERPRSQKMTSIANPSTAITELQPWQVNQEKARQGLSQLAHKDAWGREIKEPDLSNPTRNRWERPLDTIRSFQESVDRGYRRSYYGEDTHRPPSPPSQAGHSFVRGEGHSDPIAYAQMPNRLGNSATPLSNSSGEEQVAFGVMGGRNALNDSMVATNPIMSNRARNYSGGSGVGGYPDTGYGESMNHGSRGSSGNLDISDNWESGNGHWGPANAARTASPPHRQPVSASPLQPQIYPEKRNVTKFTDPPLAAAPSKGKGHKSWLGRKFGKS